MRDDRLNHEGRDPLRYNNQGQRRLDDEIDPNYYRPERVGARAFGAVVAIVILAPGYIHMWWLGGKDPFILIRIANWVANTIGDGIGSLIKPG